jgi:PKD repeat protein
MAVLATAAVAVPAVAAGPTTVGVSPASDSVDVGATTTVQVVVDDAQGGVGAAELRVAVADPSVARIENVTVLGTGSTDINSSDEDAYADIAYAFRDTANTGSVPIVEVTVEGVAAGETRIELGPRADNDDILVFDENGNPYDVTGSDGAAVTVSDGDGDGTTPTLEVTELTPVDTTVTRGQTVAVTATVTNVGSQATTERVALRAGGQTLSAREVQLTAGESRSVTFDLDTTPLDYGEYDHAVVAGSGSATGTLVVAPPTIADAPPTDLDGDGLYEDINGNGRLDYDDIVQLFESIGRNAVGANAELYDFNGNGRIDFNDIVALFKLL